LNGSPVPAEIPGDFFPGIKAFWRFDDGHDELLSKRLELTVCAAFCRVLPVVMSDFKRILRDIRRDKRDPKNRSV